MKKNILLAIGLAGVVNAMAEDPTVVKECDPNSLSGRYPGTVVANGKTHSVTLFNFGSDQISVASEYGKRFADQEYGKRVPSVFAYNEGAFNEHLLQAGMSRYHDDWFAGKFAEIAKYSFREEMHRLKGQKVSQ